MRHSIGTLGTNRTGRTTTILRASKTVSLALIPILITACTASAGAFTSGGAEGAGDLQLAAQRIAFVQEEHGYTRDPLTVTPRQRIAFVQEEHGYTPDPLTVTPRQRIAFQLEEHGYTPDPLTVTPRQRIAFQLEEHGYDVKSLLP